MPATQAGEAAARAADEEHATGAIHVVTKTPAEAAAVLSNVKQRVIRPNYSSPPRHGAAIAAEVLRSAMLGAPGAHAKRHS